jgi:hypothetical protein
MRLSSFFTRKEKDLKPHKDDPQQSAVYTMERGMIGTSINTHCPREHLEAVIRHACRKYRVAVPKLVLVNRKERVFGYSYDDMIELNRSWHGDNLGTLLHELAHWITDRLHEDDEAVKDNHGPEFVGIYANLLHAYMVMPLECFKLLARKHKLKMVSYPLP